MTQGGSRWTTNRSVTYHPSTGSRYYAPGGGSIGYMDDYGTFHRITTALYTNYSRSYLAFSDEQDSGHTLYDSTTITAEGGTPSPVYSDITILARSESTRMQTFAFDMEDEDY